MGTTGRRCSFLLAWEIGGKGLGHWWETHLFPLISHKIRFSVLGQISCLPYFHSMQLYYSFLSLSLANSRRLIPMRIWGYHVSVIY